MREECHECVKPDRYCAASAGSFCQDQKNTMLAGKVTVAYNGVGIRWVKPCPKGFYCPCPKMFDPVPCPRGAYCPGGASQPTACHFMNPEGSSDCQRPTQLTECEACLGAGEFTNTTEPGDIASRWSSNCWPECRQWMWHLQSVKLRVKVKSVVTVRSWLRGHLISSAC